MPKSTKKRRKCHGRHRQLGRDRFASGRAKPLKHNDVGTPELMARKMILTKGSEYPTTPMGILAGRKLISEVQYAASIDFRDLFVANFGPIWAKGAALESTPSGGVAQQRVPMPSKRQAVRWRHIVASLEGRAFERLVSLILHEADCDNIIAGVLANDVTDSKLIPDQGLSVKLAVLRHNLQGVADAPKSFR